MNYQACAAPTLALMVSAGLATPENAKAEEALYLAAYGGSTEAVLKDMILPEFEEEHGVRIEYVAGTSTNNLARLQAQRDNPEIDVAILDDGPMQQAVDLGLCAPVADASVLDDIYELAKRNGGGNSIGVGIVATGIAYNAKVFEDQGWPAPTSWLDLGDPKFNGRLTVPAITNTYGLHTLIALNEVQGGDLENSDPGFEFIASQVAPHVRSFETSSSKISELFQTGEIEIGVWGSGRVASLAATGFPIKMVWPKEGAMALLTTICPVADSDQPELQQQLLQHILSPKSQEILAEHKGWGPTNSKVNLREEIAESVAFGPEEVAKLVSVDWSGVNRQRSEWTKRWTREVEQ
ncbi:ABC transporter substrate-binding protein [Roseibium aggregatum]|uniref:ABC transporter substrate-binding protein n=1 Tax=Roseibium aggregatum TaxID=187304 RepID=UPI0025ABD153|nr:ABC transporter substrate-binding protein [Roseibium aggregatum]WJS05484.1 ABC transporter substrate-binding protein [Roseibium aggregatum]